MLSPEAVLLIACLALVVWILERRNRPASLSEEQNRLETSALYTIANSQDVSVVGILVQELRTGSLQSYSLASDGLIRLLPRLQEKDGGLLTRAQRDILCETLLLDGNVALVLAILDALMHIGGSKELAVVYRLARGQGRAVEDWRVQEKSQRCLSILQERTDRENTRQMLVRPADSPPATPNSQLLRPASGTIPDSPEELLRPDHRE